MIQTPTLYQFHFSHFNERARWACDYKRFAVTPKLLVPGLHVSTTRKLTNGISTSTPILAAKDEVIMGSDNILKWLEREIPERPLSYDDPDLAAEVDVVTILFENLVGAPFRRAYFDFLLTAHPGLLSRMFTHSQGRGTKIAMRLIEPISGRMLRKMDNITPDTIAEGIENMTIALDEVVARTAATGYLVGDRFTKADLTAASLLCASCWPRALSFEFPEDVRVLFETWSEPWINHPGAAWVNDICDRYRAA